MGHLLYWTAIENKQFLAQTHSSLTDKGLKGVVVNWTR